MSQTFKALVVRQDGTNFTRSIEQRNIGELPTVTDNVSIIGIK